MYNLGISQNFINNKKVLRSLLAKANFTENDLIIEIGAGKGAITQELLEYSKNIIAIEFDRNLYNQLVEKFAGTSFEIVNEKFQDYKLPFKKFKTFSNIPFSQTADILKKLLNVYPSFDTGYLIMQTDAAYKFAGTQFKRQSTMLSVIYGARYEFKSVYQFDKYDFEPAPKVDVDLIRIKIRDEAKISDSNFGEFKDFVAYIFNKSIPNIGACDKLITYEQFKRFKLNLGVTESMKPSQIKHDQYYAMFEVLKLADKTHICKGFFGKLFAEQKKIQKNYRTRAKY